MNVNINLEKLRNIYSKSWRYSYGGTGVKYSPEEETIIVDKFTKLAQMDSVSDFDVSYFEVLCEILCRFGDKTSVEDIQIKSAEMKAAFEESTAEFY